MDLLTGSRSKYNQKAISHELFCSMAAWLKIKGSKVATYINTAIPSERDERADSVLVAEMEICTFLK